MPFSCYCVLHSLYCHSFFFCLVPLSNVSPLCLKFWFFSPKYCACLKCTLSHQMYHVNVCLGQWLSSNSVWDPCQKIQLTISKFCWSVQWACVKNESKCKRGGKEYNEKMNKQYDRSAVNNEAGVIRVPLLVNWKYHGLC